MCSLLSLPAAGASRFAKFGVGPCRLVGLVGAVHAWPVPDFGVALSPGGPVPHPAGPRSLGEHHGPEHRLRSAHRRL